jgi:hypothetical protein
MWSNPVTAYLLRQIQLIALGPDRRADPGQVGEIRRQDT